MNWLQKSLVFLCIYFPSLCKSYSVKTPIQPNYKKYINSLFNLEKEDIVYLTIAVNIKYELRLPTIRLTLDQKISLKHFSRVDKYILGIKCNNYNKILNYVSLYHNFNPQAKFILLWHDHSLNTNLFELLAQKYITWVILLNLLTGELLTFRPFENKNFRKADVTPIFINFQNITQNTKIKTWKNSIVQISYKKSEPYVMNPEGFYQGMEIKVLMEIAQILKFKTQFIPYTGRYYNPKKPDTYLEAFGGLKNHQFDVKVGAIYLKDREVEDFDISYAYFQDGIYWAVPKTATIEQWRRIALVFSFSSWILFWISSIMYSCVYYLILKISTKKTFDSSILYYLFGVLMEHSSKISVFLKLKKLLVFWILYCLLISTAFKSQMMNIQSGVDYYYQAATLQDIVDSKFYINMPPGYANLYDNKNNLLEKYIYDNNIECLDLLICLRRVAMNQNTASAAIGRYTRYVMPKLLDDNGQSLIYISKEKVFSMSIHMIFSKGFPIFAQINCLLLRMEANGMIDHTYEHMDHVLKMRQTNSERRTRFFAKNDLKTLCLPFVLLLFGYISSLFALCIEYLHYKLRKK